MVAAVTISWNCADQIVLCIRKFMDLFTAVTYTLPFFSFNNRGKNSFRGDLLDCVTSGVPFQILKQTQQSELSFRTHTLFTLLNTHCSFVQKKCALFERFRVYRWIYTCEILVFGLPLSCILIYSNKISMEFLEGSRRIYRPIRVCERFFFVLMYFLKLTNE